MRGYTRTEVEAFKEAAAAALEEAKVEILKLTEEKSSLKGKYEDLKSLEETLKESVIGAQKGAEQMTANSKKEAELIIADAKLKRDEIIEEKHRKLAELETRIHELEFTRKGFYARLRSELESYLKLINQAETYGQDISAPPVNLPPKRNTEQPDFGTQRSESPEAGSNAEQFQQNNRE